MVLVGEVVKSRNESDAMSQTADILKKLSIVERQSI
jgi:hypothetical protein